jgi:hypothetical protein
VTPADLPSGGRVQNIEASPHDPAKAYFALYRYMLDDWTTYIYKTEDYGETWTLISFGIPENEPARVVREDPFMEGLLFAGTESGVYVSGDDGENWNSFQFNLPVVQVTDIRIFRDDLALSTMGRSFWILDDISPLRQLSSIGDGDVTTLFNPRNTFRSPSVQGAVFNYYLSEDAENIKLKILDPEGKLMMEYDSEGSRSIAKTKGFHRVVWDLRTFGPPSSGRRPSRGPKVIPARYKIVMELGGMDYVRPMELLPDPLLVADGITYSDYKEQFDLSLGIVELIGDAKKLTADIDELYSELNKKSESEKKLSKKETKLFAELNVLRNQLVTNTGAYPQPMLNGQLQYLYSMVSSTDQKVGKDGFIRYNELKEIVFSVRSSFTELVD